MHGKSGQFDKITVFRQIFLDVYKRQEEDRLVAKHHPFTAPMDEDIPLLETNPKAVRAKAYDIILNGCELGGGSIRIHDPELQTKMFEALGFTDEKANEQFGHLITAFKYGAPPHGGLAYGLDRLCMLLAGLDSIRDMIAFPKVQNASDLMMQCPDEMCIRDRVINGAAYHEQAQNRLTSSSTVSASRGEIVDRYGRPLVTNESVYSLRRCV